MTKEEKELLLRDLCMRLPYGMKVWYKYTTTSFQLYATSIRLAEEKIALSRFFNKEGDWFPIIEAEKILIKPYLRPMSSMTEEEKDYIKNVARFKQSDGIHYDDGVHYVPIYQETLDDQWKTDGKLPPILGDIYRFMLDYGYILLIDFFNSHHIDYRGLIEKGLALEAPEGMYNMFPSKPFNRH